MEHAIKPSCTAHEAVEDGLRARVEQAQSAVERLLERHCHVLSKVTPEYHCCKYLSSGTMFSSREVRAESSASAFESSGPLGRVKLRARRGESETDHYCCKN